MRKYVEYKPAALRSQDLPHYSRLNSPPGVAAARAGAEGPARNVIGGQPL